MKPLHDFSCLAHGVFESRSGKCPHGCSTSMVKKVFLKPPSYHNGFYAGADKNLRMLADDYKMTNLQQKAGEPAKINDWRENALNGQTVAVPFQSGASAITSALATAGVQAGNALKDMSIPQPKVQVVSSYQPKL